MEDEYNIINDRPVFHLNLASSPEISLSFNEHQYGTEDEQNGSAEEMQEANLYHPDKKTRAHRMRRHDDR